VVMLIGASRMRASSSADHLVKHETPGSGRPPQRTRLHSPHGAGVEPRRPELGCSFRGAEGATTEGGCDDQRLIGSTRREGNPATVARTEIDEEPS